eukprot:GHUV01013515.1.p1 GENE.GHUV01013515.1~~GHUV01013515.1.p1  ORF type:complete len:189 (+),score=10.15 GHUV01013515.1:736-1302(+)
MPEQSTCASRSLRSSDGRRTCGRWSPDLYLVPCCVVGAAGSFGGLSRRLQRKLAVHLSSLPRLSPALVHSWPAWVCMHFGIVQHLRCLDTGGTLVYTSVQDISAAEGSTVVTARDQWVVSSEPAPSVPDGFKLVASEHLPISVYHFYEQFLSIEATCLQDHHQSTGQYNFRASRCGSGTQCLPSFGLL